MVPVRDDQESLTPSARHEAERHYRVLDSQLAGRDYIVRSDYTIVDMSAWVGSIAPPV
jgi:glutathione S-transferase